MSNSSNTEEKESIITESTKPELDVTAEGVMGVTPKWQAINSIFAFSLLVGGIFWITQWHAFGLTMGIVGVVLSSFILKQQRWAYFGAALWCFGLLRTAMDDGHGFFQDFGSYAKLITLVGVVLAILLHEKVARKVPRQSDNSKP